MKNNCRIRYGEEGLVILGGELTFDSTPEVYRELENLFRSDGNSISIDLGEVDRTDSSGLALLLEWQAMANRKSRQLQILNAPDSLLQLAKLCEADKLLRLSTRPE